MAAFSENSEAARLGNPRQLKTATKKGEVF